MIHLYAFVEDLHGLPVSGGVQGAPVAAVETGSLTAVVSNHSGELTASRMDGALAHGLVVEELLSLAESVLPARYGETFVDEAALAEAVAPREARLRDALARVRGCVELGVRVVTLPSAATGRGYLEARVRETAAATTLDDALARFSKDTLTTSNGEHVHLVARTDALYAREAVDAFADSTVDTVVTCSGPWAPYTFGGAVR